MTYVAEPGSTVTVSVKSNGVKSYSNRQFSASTDDPTTINMIITFRNCTSGETVLSTGACKKCTSGTYLVNLDVNSK